jgi:hypothetical protein
VSGASGSISVNFATRAQGFDLKDNFNVYDLEILTGNYRTIRDGADDQPDLSYVNTDQTLKEILLE